MIDCTIPNSSPLLDFADYGCIRGYGGQGSPDDQLNRPYTNTYDCQCDKITRMITCLGE
ncbi:Phospholipase A2 [Anabarilius grahami]|uniref:Phospholipase A2 n=1 Tax=Anabarilius grahami TaxID=495550 RepID=A0A3N0YSB0_ANAGA|nr:Phospholipase A2 [Anabarilius grahami]